MLAPHDPTAMALGALGIRCSLQSAVYSLQRPMSAQRLRERKFDYDWKAQVRQS